MKELFIVNKNNQKLKTFIYDDFSSDTAIIMCHGFSGSSSGVMFPQIAKALSEEYLVCRFDFNGQG